MTNIEVKSFDSADINNVLPNDPGEAAVVEFGDVKVTRMRIKPGWRWSEHIKPMVGTDSCQVRHLGVVTKGVCASFTTTARKVRMEPVMPIRLCLDTTRGLRVTRRWKVSSSPEPGPTNSDPRRTAASALDNAPMFHTFVTQISHDRADSAAAVRKTGTTPVVHDARPPVEESLCFVSLASGQQPKT